MNDAVVAAFGMIGKPRSVARNGANLPERVRTTVCGSGVATSLRYFWKSPQYAEKGQFGERARSNENLTSSEVNGEPSVHVTPLRSLTVQVRPSALTSGRADASWGTGASLLLMTYRPLYMIPMSQPVGTSLKAGEKYVGSPSRANTRSAEVGAALALGEAGAAALPDGVTACEALGLAVAWVPPHAAKIIADTANTLTRRFRI